ncbi:uncharacterized protein YbaP (TraB family) [Duganella sp. 1411]|uniref:TraB/GumN family protein n=1 Tax=Duganella sp. 1411 TaxID=2806572 RepID=UPI001AE88F08|nr:TraB/GumN family protein [Duganella sp. 1411]MBP1205698.1 uncharacterized protein YbaP (TraB family) [Duganella sp. 1411]
MRTLRLAITIGALSLIATTTHAETGVFPVLRVSTERGQILLVGSNHLAPSNIYTKQAEQVMSGAKSLCLEASPSEKEAARRAWRATMLNATGRTIAQRHGQQLADNITRALAWNPLIADKLNNFSDQALATFLWLLPPSEQLAPPLPLQPGYSIDAALLALAGQRDAKVASIEDLDAVPKAISRITEKEWTEYLRMSVELSKCKDCLRDMASHMAQQYAKSTDYDAAYQEMRAAFGPNDKLFDLFDRITLRIRNQGMANNMYARALGRNECDVVAIGTAHLGGPNGVVALLRKMGATVTPAATEE